MMPEAALFFVLRHWPICMSAARIVDQLPHIDFFARSLVAGDMPDAASLDVNALAYACFAGTGKPVLTSAATPENAAAVIRMASIIAGSETALQGSAVFWFQYQSCCPTIATGW